MTPATTLQIVVQSSERSYQVVCRPEQFPVSIGRDPTCHIQLEDPFVSRQHLWLHVESRGVRVEDVSSNGTVVDGHSVKRESTLIKYGDPIRLGRHSVFVKLMKSDGPGSRHPQPATPPLDRHGDAPESPRPSPTLPPRAAANGFAVIEPSRSAWPAAGAPPAPASIKRPVAEVAPPEPAPSGPAPVTADATLRREIHKRVLEHLDLAAMDSKRLDDPSFRPRVLTALRRTIKSLESQLPPDLDRDRLVGEMADEALGLGPLEQLLADDEVREIMVIDAATIYVERGGRIVRSDKRFTDDDRVRAVIERIVTPLGRRIDESSPLVDARLPDGSRVNAIIRPLALRGSCITIRKFARTPLHMTDLLRLGTLSEAMGKFLFRSVAAKKNIVISGGTGSGKTTLLNVLSSAISDAERIVTIEDSAELQLKQPHVVSLETRPPNMEGKGEYSIRDLVKNALRMRPDRIVVGECRGGEALDMLQAMNTGHDGSLTTTHANSPLEALGRLETLCLMSGLDLPARAIREQIAKSIQLIVQQSRLSDGSRRIVAIAELGPLKRDGNFALRDIYRFVRTGAGEGGRVEGDFRATGYLPSYLGELLVRGLIRPGEAYI
jgi:pilus assembly protein CpaF